MVAIEIVDGDHLDYESYTKLQREAYADLLSKLKVSNEYMSKDFFRWKFHPPAGSARIGLVYEDSQLVSSSALVPVKLCFKQKIIHGWQATDASTLATVRKKGYLFKSVAKLTKSLADNELIYVFPNKTSIRAPEKLHYQNKGIMTTWIKTAAALKKRLSEHVHTITKFSKDQDSFSQRLAACNKVMITRSAEYLNWRYINHPIYEYVSFVYQDEEEQQGFSVVRKANLMGRDMVVIMELWGLTPRIIRALLRHVVHWANQQRITRIILQDNSQSMFTGLRRGFILIPSWFLPKKQYLMVYAAPGKISQEAVNSNWWVQTGDWDSL